MGQTARHLKNYCIVQYRGLKKLILKDLNDINILTGNNNSGKTSVLELLSTMQAPWDISTWIKICRLSGNGSYYAGMLNLFPTDLDHMLIHFFYNKDFDAQFMTMRAEIRETFISQREFDEMNGHQFKDADKEIDFVETKCLHLDIGEDSDIKKSYIS